MRRLRKESHPRGTTSAILITHRGRGIKARKAKTPSVASKPQPPEPNSFPTSSAHGTARLILPDTRGLKSKTPTHVLSPFHLKFSLTETGISPSLLSLLKLRQKHNKQNSSQGAPVELSSAGCILRSAPWQRGVIL